MKKLVAKSANGQEFTFRVIRPPRHESLGKIEFEDAQ